MSDKSIDKCDVCKKDAEYLDVVGPHIVVPFCDECLADSLILLELEKRRVIVIEEWEEWHEEHPDVRIGT